MLELTGGQRKSLEFHLKRLKSALVLIEETVTASQFPYSYPESQEVINRQMTAINSLLETGKPGCELSSLRYLRATDAKSHLQNLAFLGQKLKHQVALTDEVEAIRKEGSVPHSLKDSIANICVPAYEEIASILHATKRVGATPVGSGIGLPKR